MSSEGTASSLFQDSDSSDIATVSSVSSSMTSSVSPSQDPMGLLLLQIQQYHSSKVQKLQEKVRYWKAKCDRIAEISNDNALSATTYSMENRFLKAQVNNLRKQLHALKNQRRNGLQNSSGVQASFQPKAELPNKEADLRQGQNEALLMQMNKIKKLASKKSNKKVRYSEVPPNNGFQKPEPNARKLDPLPNGDAKPAANLLLLSGGTNKSASRIPSEEILAPNTCLSPVGEASPSRYPNAGATLPRYGKAMGRGGGQEPRIKNVYAVPETLDVKHNNSDLELSDEESIEDPTYASTPIGGHSQMPFSKSELILTHSTVATPEITKPMKKFAGDLSSRQKLLTTPLPKSESQFPVDLNRTQNRSPTFCGEGSTTPVSTGGSSRLHGTHNADRNVPTPSRGDPSDLRPKDESYESDASIQLLNIKIPKKTSPQLCCSFTSGSGQVLPKSKEKVCLEDTATSLKRRPLLTTKYMCKSPELVPKPRLNSPKKHLSKRRKVDIDVEPNSFDETVLPDGEPVGKENSPEGLDNLVAMPSGRSKMRQHPRAEKAKEITLKQSKLTPKMFQASVNKSASLMREYNGGSLVNVDSQQDAFMNLALEKSLLDQKAVKPTKKDSEVVPRGFKVPNLPRKSQLRSTPEAKTDPKSSPSLTKGAVPQSSQDKFSDLHHDLNGSIDPFLDLTRLENGNASTSEHFNHFNTGRSFGDTTGRHKLSDHEDEHFQETGEDSCPDLFQEEAEDRDEKLDKSSSCESNGSMTSFDQIPKVKDKPNYKYTEVVRKQSDRQKLKGFGCKECETFYKDLPLTASQLEDRMKMCSRHRAQFSPPHTPDHYWSIGFPDTQTCLQRGYLRESKSPERGRRKQKKKKYKMLFSGKEGDGLGENEDVE